MMPMMHDYERNYRNSFYFIHLPVYRMANFRDHNIKVERHPSGDKKQQRHHAWIDRNRHACVRVTNSIGRAMFSLGSGNHSNFLRTRGIMILW